MDVRSSDINSCYQVNGDINYWIYGYGILGILSSVGKSPVPLRIGYLKLVNSYSLVTILRNDQNLWSPTSEMVIRTHIAYLHGYYDPVPSKCFIIQFCRHPVASRSLWPGVSTRTLSKTSKIKVEGTSLISSVCIQCIYNIYIYIYNIIQVYIYIHIRYTHMYICIQTHTYHSHTLNMYM